MCASVFPTRRTELLEKYAKLQENHAKLLEENDRLRTNDDVVDVVAEISPSAGGRGGEP